MNKKKKAVQTKNPFLLSEKVLKCYALLLPLLTLLVIGIALLIHESAYLYRAQELNLFLYTPLYLKQLMVASGGLLAWLGSYFTQYFYYPWLGILMLCGWWALFMWVTKKAFCIPAKWTAVLLIPVLALLLTDVSIGYWLYYVKLRGYFFAATIGATLAVALAWAYRSLPSRWFLRPLFMVVSTALMYPCFGFYGLLATALMAVLAWRVDDYKLVQRIVDSVVAVVAIAAVTLLYYRFWFYQTNIVNILWTGLPIFRLSDDYYIYYVPYYILVGSLVLMAAAYRLWDSAVRRPVLWLLSQAVVVIALASTTWHFWYKDANFHAELKMEQCAWEQDWEGILTEFRNSDEECSRMMWMMKNLALFRLGTAGDQMYHYKNGDRKPDAPFTVRMAQAGGKMIYYNYGQLNFCYRWCLEDGVEYGWRVEYYKYMLKCSLLNGELTVAQKYIDVLKKTKFHREWAERYEPYVKNPSLIKKDKDMELITHLLKTNDDLSSDNSLIEIYLLNRLSVTRSTDPLLHELTLLSAMQKKDIQIFWGAFFQYAQSHQNIKMPIHFQEAAYLYGHLENQVDISRMPFDKEVVDTYNDFMAEAQRYQGMTEEQMKPMMYNRFGGTFYYDYFFTRGQRSY